MDYQKFISEKWNLTAKFNCLQLQAIYFDAPSALAVPMCAPDHDLRLGSISVFYHAMASIIAISGLYLGPAWGLSSDILFITPFISLLT